MEIESGTRILQYTLDCLIGSGGWGQVWKAHDDSGSKTVAIKILQPRDAGSGVGAKARERFKREAEVMCRLQSPWLCHAYTCCEDCSPFLAFVMEYIEGCNLSEYVRKEGTPSSAKIKEWLVQILAALKEIHGQGIVHRDIKPSNIMLQPSGEIKLFDFGICKDLTVDYSQTHAAVYSMYYASPEQKLGDNDMPITASSDYYSLGKTILYLTTGKTPPPGRVTDMHLAMVSDPELRAIIAAFTKNDASARYAAVRKCVTEIWGDEVDELPTLVDIPESRGANRVDAGISEQPTLVDALDKKKSDEYTARASAKYVIYLVIFVAIIMAVYFATYKALVDNIKTPAEPIKIENPDAHSIHSITHIGNSLSLFRHQ